MGVVAHPTPISVDNMNLLLMNVEGFGGTVTPETLEIRFTNDGQPIE